MILMCFIALFLFVFLLDNPIVQFQKFLLMVFTGGISLSLLFTTLAAIAGKAGGNSAMIAILGFPVVIPQIILLSDLSKPLFVTMQVSGWWSFFFALLLLDFLIVILSIILFPFIWKE
jgi:heme exporter protein B